MNIKVGKLIKVLRNTKGLTQNEFAEQLNVSRDLVSKWEQGKSSPDYDTLKRIGETFNIDPKRLAETDEFIFEQFSACIPNGITPHDAAKLVRVFTNLLTDSELELYAMRFVECLSTKQIAERLHYTDGTIRNKLVRIRKNLKAFLAAAKEE